MKKYFSLIGILFISLVCLLHIPNPFLDSLVSKIISSKLGCSAIVSRVTFTFFSPTFIDLLVVSDQRVHLDAQFKKISIFKSKRGWTLKVAQSTIRTRQAGQSFQLIDWSTRIDYSSNRRGSFLKIQATEPNTFIQFQALIWFHQSSALYTQILLYGPNTRLVKLMGNSLMRLLKLDLSSEGSSLLKLQHRLGVAKLQVNHRPVLEARWNFLS